ncbi:DUF6221 family protein [Streptomyces sp. NPDC097640]|uniref:DUF6221 family protein n=1 Tax=Streptomyces sp. NPDC097640 TaxID=3157229 RepID=UPI00331C61E7
MTKPRLSEEEHAEIGRMLAQMQADLTHLSVKLGNAYLLQGEEAAPVRKVEAVGRALETARGAAGPHLHHERRISMTDDLVWFLIRRFLEDELNAQQATPGPWSLRWHGQTLHVGRDDGGELDCWFTYAIPTREPEVHEARAECDTRDAEYIARHHPARVLDEVEAKEQILTLHRFEPFEGDPDRGFCRECQRGGAAGTYPCPTVRLLALPYASHPDYRAEWRP